MTKLNALTTFRFFAAMAIVLFHLEGHFGLSKILITGNFAQAVSFFFVLSGFILSYVYRSLDHWDDKKKFFIARFARIWPVHIFFFVVVGLLASFSLMSNIQSTKSAFLSFFLLQAWIPIPRSYFSYNSPAWSISTEFFFYLCFPFIIKNWSKTWHWKSCLILSLPCVFIYLSTYFQLPNFNLTQDITNHGVLNINPLARLPEFLLGILGGRLWIKYKDYLEFNYTVCSVIEFLSIFLIMINIYFYVNIVNLFLKLIPTLYHSNFQLWASNGIFTGFSFILLIGIFAKERGCLSTFFSHPLGVLLGEMSFSIYLSHQILYRLYMNHLSLFEGLSNKFLFTFYMSLLFSISFLSLKFVEYPCRAFLRNNYKPTPANNNTA